MEDFPSQKRAGEGAPIGRRQALGRLKIFEPDRDPEVYRAQSGGITADQVDGDR